MGRPLLMPTSDKIQRRAVFSPDKKYRYALYRKWETPGPIRTVSFILLNPATANVEKDDPTAGRCIDFAMTWGYSGADLFNMNPFVSTNPGDLKDAGEDELKINDMYLTAISINNAKVIIGWGNQGGLYQNRISKVLGILTKYHDIYCFGVTNLGQPRHPLYVPKCTESSLSIFRCKVQ